MRWHATGDQSVRQKHTPLDPRIFSECWKAFQGIAMALGALSRRAIHHKAEKLKTQR